MSTAFTRRSFMQISSAVMASAALAATPNSTAASANRRRPGEQRLSLKELEEWESLKYGMFIHFGMSTYDGEELSKGTASSTLYAPDKLDVDQWISVARDAGMAYAVLTTKHVSGHCLWPTKHTDYSVATSSNKTDVVEKFVEACAKHGVKPGFYYCSWDNHHRFGSQTPTDIQWTEVMNRFPKEGESIAPYTSSLYQTFQTAQVTELLTQYGEIAEVWIDIPGILGRGYRTFLYNHIAALQPSAVVMMNSGIGDGAEYNIDYAWPSDLIAIERRVPPQGGHQKWREIEGKEYYMPGEICDPIGKEWFYVEGDMPRSDEELQNLYETARQANVNLLLDVPPDKSGVVPKTHVDALMRLKKKARI